MIYSRWRPDRGGYDYFESSETVGISDDMPVPSLSEVGGIGAPSTEIGRPKPVTARPVGAGALARGGVLPLDRSTLSGIGTTFAGLPAWVWMAAGITIGWVLGRSERRAS